MPGSFQSPVSSSPHSRSLTHYQAILGPGTAFDNPEGATLGPPEKSPLADGLRRRGMQFDESRTSIGDFPDGIDSTLMILAARQAVDWSRPSDVTILPGVPIPPLGEGGMSRRTLFGRPGITGFNAAFVDGRVRTFPLTTPESTLRALFSRNGGETIPLGDE